MTWINNIPRDQASGYLLECYEAISKLYPAEYGDPVPAVQYADGTSDSVSAAHSLIPDAMRHIMSVFGVLMQPDLPLTRRQQEMIATVVSAKNQCYY